MDNKKLTCFVVAPIGETGSQIREDSDNLLDIVIKPVLDVFHIDVIRGDHRNESGQIDVDVIKLVQESDLCIVDVSIENVNVYYEMGRRDETGKPIILLKSSSSPSLPVDVATRRYIEYNLKDLRSLTSAKDSIKECVQQFVDSGMEKTKGTSLFAISEKIDKIERMLTRLSQSSERSIRTDFTSIPNDDWEKYEPQLLLKYALSQRNVPMAEYAMDKISYTLDELDFYDYIVEQVAVLGSRKAGQMLIDYVETYIDSESRTQKQIEYIGCLVTYLNKTNQERQYVIKIEQVALKIKDENGQVPSQAYNQLNRLYFGIYQNENDVDCLDKAIYYLGKAIEIDKKDGSLYYNYATCYSARADVVTEEKERQQAIQMACENIREAIKLDGEENDDDHLALACRLFYRVNDPLWEEYYEILKKINPIRAKVLKKDL